MASTGPTVGDPINNNNNNIGINVQTSGSFPSIINGPGGFGNSAFDVSSQTPSTINFGRNHEEDFIYDFGDDEDDSEIEEEEDDDDWKPPIDHYSPGLRYTDGLQSRGCRNTAQQIMQNCPDTYFYCLGRSCGLIFNGASCLRDL